MLKRKRGPRGRFVSSKKLKPSAVKFTPVPVNMGRAGRAIASRVSRGFVSSRAADAKFFDVAFTNYDFNTTGSVTHLENDIRLS